MCDGSEIADLRHELSLVRSHLRAAVAECDLLKERLRACGVETVGDVNREIKGSCPSCESLRKQLASAKALIALKLSVEKPVIKTVCSTNTVITPERTETGKWEFNDRGFPVWVTTRTGLQYEYDPDLPNGVKD